MSLIIFFGIALGIFLMGLLVISVTIYQWKKQADLKKLNLKTESKK